MQVFIAENDPIVADVLSTTLEEAGHFETTASKIESMQSCLIEPA